MLIIEVSIEYYLYGDQQKEKAVNPHARGYLMPGRREISALLKSDSLRRSE